MRAQIKVSRQVRRTGTRLKCHLKRASLQVKHALSPQDPRRGREREKRWAGPHRGFVAVATTRVINMLPPTRRLLSNPTRLWSNPGWAFQGCRWGQEKPALLAHSTSPCRFLGARGKSGSWLLLIASLGRGGDQQGAEARPPSQQGDGPHLPEGSRPVGDPAGLGEGLKEVQAPGPPQSGADLFSLPLAGGAEP